MTRTVHKYRLTIADRWQELRLPVGAQIVHVAEQPPGSGEFLQADDGGSMRASLFLWAEVAPSADLEIRRLVTVGTGQEIPRTPAGHRPYHVASVVTASGALVWHVYAEPNL